MQVEIKYKVKEGNSLDSEKADLIVDDLVKVRFDNRHLINRYITDFLNITILH